MENGLTYYNKFFEGREEGSVFSENPMLSNLTQKVMWDEKAQFYFLPYLINCYKFTKRHKLPYFALMVSPTFIFHRDRLHLRNFMDTIHKAMFKMMGTCGLLDQQIMLLVEKRFHIERPIQGGSQQLYNMLWDIDLNPKAQKCPFIIPGDETGTGWDGNPGMPFEGGLDLSRRTLWFIDDLNFLCTKYDLTGEYHCTEVLEFPDYITEEKRKLYKPREFYFKVFTPKELPPFPPEPISSDSDLDDGDSTETDFDFDSTQSGQLDSTLDFEEDYKEMNKIISFFANIPKVTRLVQGMLDMMTSLTRILPLVITKLDDSDQNKKLKDALVKTVSLIDKGIGKVIRICGYLGIKVDKKSSCAVQTIVKDRFKKDKKDFIEYEVDELNNALDRLEKVDEPSGVLIKGKVPPDIDEHNKYPQVMPMGGHHHCHPHPDPVHEFLSQGHDKVDEGKS